MRARFLSQAPVLVAIAAFLLASSVDAAPPPPKVDGAAIVRGAGRVKLDSSHDWRETTTGAVLTAGVTVQASNKEPLEMILPDAVTIILEPGAIARWMPASKLPTETNSWTRGYHLVLRDGEIDVRMPEGPKGAHAFLVSTKAGTLTDWRGTLHVMVHDDVTAAAIYEGALVVGSNGQGFPVYDGAGILMRKGVNPDKSRGIPGAPTWNGGVGGAPSFVVLPAGASATVGFAWAAVPGAQTYRVEVASDPSMVPVFHRATTNDPRYVMPDGAPATRYYAHVLAVGAEGIVGPWSTPRPVRVVHYDLPDGAVVGRDGVIVLPDQARVRLSDTEGVEVAYENVRSLARGAVPLYWSKLAGPIQLSEDSPMRIVHLRDPALDSGSQLVLARRELRADVDLEPKGARSGDRLSVRVSVADPSGRIDVSSENVAIEVTSNLDPLTVAWQRSGATWTAIIPARGTLAPSVVRVVVKDGRGMEIGRGFLEMAGFGAQAAR